MLVFVIYKGSILLAESESEGELEIKSAFIYNSSLLLLARSIYNFFLGRQKFSIDGIAYAQQQQTVMTDIIRDSPFGQLLRLVTRNRVLLYPEEKPDFQIPASYTADFSSHEVKHVATEHPYQHPSNAPPTTTDSHSSHHPGGLGDHLAEPLDLEKAESTRSSKLSDSHINAEHSDGATDPGFSRPLSPIQALWSRPQGGEEAIQQQMSRTRSLVVVPTRTTDGKILADWYVTDDAANPQNWSPMKKAWTAFNICESWTFPFAVSGLL